MSKRSRIAKRRQRAWRAYWLRVEAMLTIEIGRAMQRAMFSELVNGGRGL